MRLSDFSPAQRQYLQQINAKLTVIEKHAKREALELIQRLNAKIQDTQDWLYDYEIDLEVSFWLREDDPEYQEEDDNILVTISEGLKGLPERDFGIEDGINHNAFQQMDGHPLQTEFHCWLYHCLSRFAHFFRGFQDL